jgi:Flp pilus assembly protein TadD
LDIDPNSVEALTNLGNALVHQGRFVQAEIYYRAALRFDSNSPVIHFNLAVALTRQGRTTEGQAELDEAKRLEAEKAAGR